MTTFNIYTLGCKVNQYESAQLHQLLTELGLTPAASQLPADLALVNTCCVTHVAASKSRQYIRRALKENPGSEVIVTGCLPKGSAEELGRISEKVTITRSIEQAVSAAAGYISRQKTSKTAKPVDCKYKNLNNSPILKEYAGKTRAFLKVQDGCDAHCTYCIIPKLRAEISSKPVELVTKEAQNLVKAGHKEIILTGIYLGAYGRATTIRKKWGHSRGDLLAELVDKVAQTPNLPRLRLSSLEPADLSDRLLDVMASRPNIMPHLHLPLQSGSDTVLKKMARQYRIAHFMQVIEKTRAKLDNPAITTDVIVGFPGETEEDFKQTLDICRRAEFSKIHVFSYSRRKNTAADKMPGRLGSEVIKERSKTLRELDKKLQKKFREKFKGKTVSVLIESLDPPKGTTERYFTAKCNENKSLNIGDIVNTTLI